MRKRAALQRLALGMLLVAPVALLSACSREQKPAFKAIDVTGADYAQDFVLADHLGKQRQMADFRGKVVIVFFGYTQCPDVCPTTMLQLGALKKALDKDADRLQVLFVTVDPERDTQAILRAYMENFDPAFLALRPTPEQLPELARHFKVYYKRVEGSTPTSYTMDHSAGSYIYDPQGRVRLFSRYGAEQADELHDIQLLLRGA